MTPTLLCTEDMITYLVGTSTPEVRAVVRERLYDWRRDGRILNMGGIQRNRAMWDVVAVLAVAGQYALPSQCVA